jgi:class 3 adenylate cyclase/DNA-binding CsgD family transcriptional regulator
MLFTDIEGSTRLLRQLRDGYGELLADHHRILRAACDAHGGSEFGTQGDALFVAFGRARSAAEAAVEAQLALAAHGWPEGVECRVRMGMHTGEPSVGEAGYHGLVLHRCARIAAAAHGGQVLVSSATAEILHDDLPDGCSLRELGAQPLKDFERPERLYQLEAAGLLTEFSAPQVAKEPVRPAPRTRRGPPELIGRDHECELLDEVLDDARDSRSRSLVIRGEAGVGKSALLLRTIDRAEGFRVLRATGFESDADLAFSGLLQLLRPVLERLDELPDHQADALAGALGLKPGQEVERLQIGVATLGLIALAAEDDDILLAIDDAQWLDSASNDAILFASRRFEADRVAVVLTVREGESDYATPGLEELRLDGLSPEASGLLLASHSSVGLAPGVADRLYELTNGNPLALVELPRVLSEEQLHGVEPFEQPLNLGSRVERAFRGRVEALSPDAQRALLIASASESDALDSIVAALAVAGIDPEALQEAEDAGLISLVDQSLLFRHPLARSAVYHSVAASERRSAHTALANALTGPRDVERRAWQLASAALGPDEGVAEALEDAAAAARERGGWGGASAAYERAARLSTEHDSRTRRLLAAGDAAWNAGQTARAIVLLEEGLADCRDQVLRGQLLNIRAHIERHVGDARIAYPWFIEAAEILDDVAPIDAACARIGAWRASLLAGNGQQLAVAQALMDHAELDSGIQEFLACLALSAQHPDAGRRRELRLRAKALVEERGDEVFSQEPRYVSLAGMAGTNVDSGLSISAWAVEWARERGVYGALAVALGRRAGFERRLDQWPAAYATLQESVALSGEQGIRYFHRTGLIDLADLEAVRGDEAACRAHVDEARALAPFVGSANSLTESATLGLLELSLGRFEAVIAELEPLVLGGVSAVLRSDPTGDAVYEPVIPDLLEAYLRVGRRADAERLVAPRETFTEKSGSQLAHANTARIRGLLADDDSFEKHFVDALGHHAEYKSSFDEARTRLCFGERLRRAQRRRDARDQLRPALETFERLGAAPWAERTRGELRATGERLRARDEAREELTAQELRIALLAAEGKTNRQIGATMFLSPKTVEFHLGRAYRKLGISSRAELIRHFATAPSSPELSVAAND